MFLFGARGGCRSLRVVLYSGRVVFAVLGGVSPSPLFACWLTAGEGVRAAVAALPSPLGYESLALFFSFGNQALAPCRWLGQFSKNKSFLFLESDTGGLNKFFQKKA